MEAEANLRSCVHKMVGLRILRKEHGRKWAHNTGHQEGRPGPVQGLAWKDAVGDSSAEKVDPEHIDFQQSSPLSSRVVHPDVQEVKPGGRRCAWMNKELLTQLKHRKEANEVILLLNGAVDLVIKYTKRLRYPMMRYFISVFTGRACL